MKRKDIRIEPPPQGWDILQFVDGYKAQIVGAVVENIDGIDWIKYHLRPFPDLEKRYDIGLDELDEYRTTYRRYPKQMVITLNEDDPSRKLKFCLLNWNGKETPATRYFLGYSQNKEIEKLREKAEFIRIENAKLKEENILLKTNIPKYIKNNFQAIAGDIMPLMERLSPNIGGEESPSLGTFSEDR